MEAIQLTKEKYIDWDNFCLKNDEAWFWQTTGWLDFFLNYKIELKPQSRSFLVFEDRRLLAVCSLILETKGSIKEYSFGDSYGPVPVFEGSLNKKERERVMKFVFETIDQLAKQDEVSRVRMKFSILDVSNLKGLTKFNYLMKFGFFDNTINTQILDLSKTTEELKSDLRHGHSSDITKASKVLTVEFFDNKSINLEIFNQYVSLHQLASGKKTRPEITFQMMFNWIKEGEAFLVGAKKEEQFVGFSFFYLYKDNVYYGSSCNNPDLRELPISHFIQWQAINFMHQKGYRYYEIGWQHFYPSLSDFPSKKEIDISRFKRGFGGFTCLLMRGEKFYNNEYLIKCYQESLKKIIG